MCSDESLNEEFIDVFVRIKPLDSSEWNRESIYNISNDQQIQTVSNRNTAYTFNYVFDASRTQENVFDVAVAPVIKAVLNGYNCTVLTYGQAGTGKTYTMYGPINSSEANSGVILRSVARISDCIKNKGGVMLVSCVDLCNEEFVDMLSTNENEIVKCENVVRIYEDAKSKGSLILEGLREVAVTCRDDIEDVIKKTEKKRRKAVRSHTIFSLTVRVRETNFRDEDVIKIGRIHFVDLAGSESNAASEDKNVNISLFTLRKVITAITEKRAHIPYREAKLTRFLRDSLKGSTKTTLIATISPSRKNLDDSISTLVCASKMRSIQNSPKPNQLVPVNLSLKQYTDEILKLKRDLEASRTNTGVVVNKETYDDLVAEQNRNRIKSHDVQRNIIDVEKKLEVQTEKLESTEDRLQKATRKREDLKADVQTLNEDLRVATQRQIRKRQELEVARAIESYFPIENSLQTKISFLYKSFDENAVAMKEFRILFHRFNRHVFDKLGKCVDLAITNSSCEVDGLKRTLDTTCSEVNDFICDALEFTSDMLRLKTEYDSIKQSDFKSADDVKDDIDLMVVGLDDLLKEIENYLAKLSRHVEFISETRNRSCEMVVGTLGEVRRLAADSEKNACAAVERAEQIFWERLREMVDVDTTCLEKVSSVCENTEHLQKECEADLDAMLDSVMETEDSLNEVHDEILSNCKEAESTSCELTRAQMELSEAYRSSTTKGLQVVSNECDNRKIGEQLAYLSASRDKEELLRLGFNKCLEVAAESSEEHKQELESSSERTKNCLLKFNSDFEENEGRHDMHFNETTDLCQRVHGNCSSMLETYRNLLKYTDGACDVLKSISDHQIATLPNMQESYRQQNSHLTEVVERFCDGDLKRATHAGDTPQRSQRSPLDLSGINHFLHEASPSTK